VTTKRRRKGAADATEPTGAAVPAPAVPDDACTAVEPSAAPVDAPVRLPAALQIRTVEATGAELRAALARGALRLDGAAVSRVDTAGLQLLVAAIASARAAGVATEWQATSPALIDGARQLGVGALLSLPAAG
jgi:anti-anti-sigma regulatory factor